MLCINNNLCQFCNGNIISVRNILVIYIKKYPQSLLAYFRTISLRGMQIKPPEISQIISLLGQDSVIKKINENVSDKKDKENEWVIIPPIIAMDTMYYLIND